MLRSYASGRIEVVQGDITKLRVEAIVNAANSSLMGGGGVDGAIHRAGGPAILEECKKIRRDQFPDGLPPGKAVVTGGGRLRCKVIHTVGPVWHGGSSGEERLLSSAYRESLEIAARESLETLAFPAISTGVYGYPKDAAARVALETITAFLRKNELPRKVLLVFFSEQDAAVFVSSVPQEQPEEK
jgi:O-acetyl-ADP-ribose deacetylase (regulator of RNase III)